MNRTFTVNNKLYKAKPFDFNLLCDLEDQGLSLEDIERKPMSLIRTYVAFCGNIDKERAGKEIESHVVSGGNFDAVTEVLAAEMEDSGFFQALREKAETETPMLHTEVDEGKEIFRINKTR